MRNVHVYLLTLLLLVGLFTRCNKESKQAPSSAPVPSTASSAPAPWKKPSFEEYVYLLETENPSGPAILIHVQPPSGSIARAGKGILLQFNKRPENLKIDPPFDLYRTNHPNIVSISGFPKSSKVDIDVRGIDLYWGPEQARQSTRLTYTVIPDLKDPNWKPSTVPSLWTELPPEEFLAGLTAMNPSGPAILIDVLPKNGSVARAGGGIAVKFNKRPENLKIDPPLQFHFIDENFPREVKRHLMRWGNNFKQSTIPFRFYNGVYISGPPKDPKVDIDVRIIDLYWGPEYAQQSARLIYTVVSGI